MTPARVLIVDDSATIRGMIRAVASSEPRLTVVGEAGDPYEARALIKELNPDVITLDIEMPRMNGLEFLEKLMRLRPMPVVMVSTRTRDKSVDAVHALSLGAVDCVDVAGLQASAEIRARLVGALVVAGQAKVGQAMASVVRVPRKPSQAAAWNGRTILIGSSTGGVDALERVLSVFPERCPPTLIAQHMPPAFLESFARRLDASMAPRVRTARSGDAPEPGEVLIAPGGDVHLTLSQGAAPRVAAVPSTADDAYVPSVDHLFRSALPMSRRVVAAILTGMGRDGSAGLKELRAGGAHTLAQSGDTCVVDSMPRAAREAGAVMESLPIDAIGERLLDLCRWEKATAESAPP